VPSSTTILAESTRPVVLFGDYVPNLSDPPHSGRRLVCPDGRPMPNMWIHDESAAYSGLDIRPEARASAVPTQFNKLTRLVNLSQLSVPPGAPPASLHMSWSSKKPYGQRMQALLSHIALQNGLQSKWWMSFYAVGEHHLRLAPKQRPFDFSFPSEGKFFHISHLVDPEKLRTWPISAKTGRLYSSRATDTRFDVISTLRAFQLKNGFLTGVYYPLGALRELHLKVKPGAAGVSLGVDDEAPEINGNGDTRRLQVQEQAKSDSGSNVVVKHWYNIDDVMFPEGYRPPPVADTFDGSVPVNGATGRAIDESLRPAPSHASPIWFEAKYLLACGAKVDVNCAPFTTREVIAHAPEMINVDQLECPAVGLRLCGTGYNVMSRRVQSTMNSVASKPLHGSESKLTSSPSKVVSSISARDRMAAGSGNKALTPRSLLDPLLPGWTDDDE
jgi:hypothetical protein